MAHKEIDLKNPKPNRGHAGFTDEERAKFDNVVSSGLVDSFRHFYPDLEGAYSWWSYRFSARQKNAGWCRRKRGLYGVFICHQSAKIPDPDRPFAADASDRRRRHQRTIECAAYGSVFGAKEERADPWRKSRHPYASAHVSDVNDRSGHYPDPCISVILSTLGAERSKSETDDAQIYE